MLSKLVTVFIFSGFVLLFSCSTQNIEMELTQFVNPFVGTDGHGHTYPGASMPFGMVQLSPDTRLSGWDGCSGYHYSDSIIYGFSHTHLSGTGCSDYGDILFMPTLASANSISTKADSTAYWYKSGFSHEEETASPGYYSVELEDHNIQVELTTTARAGFHKYIFPANRKPVIVVDLKHRDEVLDSYIRIVDEYEIEGFRRSKSWAEDQQLFFVARFSKPFSEYTVITNDTIRNSCNYSEGKNIKALFYYDSPEDEEILVKVGISAVSTDGARLNLNTEIPDWNFEAIRMSANKEWNTALNKIQVEGGSLEQKKTFYTALYHTMLSPNLFMDTDGSYLGTDRKIHLAKGYINYSVFSLWDTYRATHPLFTLIERKRTADFINTFLSHYQNGGQLPVWELAANYTACMIGYHSVSVISDAFCKGITGFNPEDAYVAMTNSAEKDEPGLNAYRRYGYIPADMESESVSKTLEYAYDDWCIAMMADKLGKEQDYISYLKRAQYYKNVFDASTGYMRAKANGAWQLPFDPKEVNFNYTEANSWQYSFYVPHDISGLIKLAGGKEDFEQQIDSMFSSDNQTTGRNQVDITGLIGQYAHGNEPSHHIAYLYNYTGSPHKTQQRVRQIMKEQYSSKADGLCGNEDCGQMSAWYILSAMGLYQVAPGDENYCIGSPLFSKLTIRLENGNSFVINAKDVSDTNMYIQNALLNNREYQQSYISYSDIIKGGELMFEMSDKPNKKWATAPGEIPRTAILIHEVLAAPFVSTGQKTFFDSLEISLSHFDNDVQIFYSINDSLTNENRLLYTEPLKIYTTIRISAIAAKEGMINSHTMEAEYFKIPGGRSITIASVYNPQYSAGGSLGLIDYIRGGNDFRTGSWQGYQGQDFEAVVDLGSTQKITKLGAGFLQDVGSWIVMPLYIEFLSSADGTHFSHLQSISPGIPVTEPEAVIRDFYLPDSSINARYIKVKAKNYGTLPDWHPGAGGESFIFIDEIIIE